VGFFYGRESNAYSAWLRVLCLQPQTDGLLHISNLSVGFVSDVKEVLSEGQEIEVRIIKIDQAKNQVALSMLSTEQGGCIST
jgi:general stress protein 13